MRASVRAYAVVPNTLGAVARGRSIPASRRTRGLARSALQPDDHRRRQEGPGDNPYWRDCADDELTYQLEGLAAANGLRLDRVNRRVSLLEQFDAGRRALDRDSVARERVFDANRRRALALATSAATRRALDVRGEDPRPGDRYGWRPVLASRPWWARRPVEAGVRVCHGLATWMPATATAGIRIFTPMM